MNQTTIQGLVLIVLLLPLPLISTGATANAAVLWVLGLVLLCVGGLVPAALRYVPVDDEEE